MLLFAGTLARSGDARASGISLDFPRTEDGPGIKVGGNSRVHPGFALGVGYDSNVFSTNAPRSVRDAMYLAPTGWIGVGNRRIRNGVLDSPVEASARLVDYNLSAIGGYRSYLTRRETVKDASRFNMSLRGRLVVAPARRFSLALNEDMSRLGEPRNFEASREYHFDRLHNSFSAHAIVRPATGRLSLRFGYLNRYLYFMATDLSTGDRTVNGFEHESKWRFRDRSALVVRYQWLWTFYLNCCAQPGTGRNEDSKAHRAWAGFVGQLGRRAEMEALVGYGYGRYEFDVNGPNFSKPIGRLGISYFPTPRTRLQVRAQHSFQDALFGNYHVTLGGEAFASHQFRWKMLASLGAAVSQRHTAGLPVPGRETQDVAHYDAATDARRTYKREDWLYSGQFRLEQSIGRLFVLGLHYTAHVTDTSFAIYYTNGDISPGAYQRHRVMLVGAVRY
ncbi:MAG: hypothetical protein V3V08_19570 [Nannocystaceae bacterium]